MSMYQHISKQFDNDLENIRSQVLEMGGLVENQLSDAVNALISSDLELAETVLKAEYGINRYEVSIDEECIRILAKRQPAAVDLRLIMAIIKTITDLERIGDEAEKIGYLASRLAVQELEALRRELAKIEGNGAALTLDPASDGTGLENLQTLCVPCHKRKTAAMQRQRSNERKGLQDLFDDQA